MTVNSDDFYELLGVSRGASEKEIKSAYKKAARKYHPDNNDTGSEEMFKKVGEAYETLKDPQKKTIYDQYGKEGLKGMGGFGGAGGFGGFQGAAGFEDISDIFSSFFGGGFGGASGGSSRQRASRGQDQVVELTMDFLDPVVEHKKKIRFNPLVGCSTCDTKGYENDTDVKTCSTCNGAGQVSSVQNTILGQFRQVNTCSKCNGSGKEITKPCKPCKGKGFTRENKEVEVTIPAGIYDGANIRLGGMGDAGQNGGPPGDIYLSIHIKDHNKFERQDADIASEVQIGFYDAALGTKLEIDTVRGNKEVEIKSGTQSGDVITLKNEGMPEIGRPTRNGHHYLKVNVVTPKSPSGKEKELLRELKELRRDKDTKI